MNGWVGCTLRWRTLALAVMASGCGPMIELEGDTEPTSDDGLTSTTPGTTSTTTSGTTTPPGTTLPPGTTVPLPDTTTGIDDTWGNFIPEPDWPWPGDGCSIFAQDCFAGEKCMPWADDGGSVWNATRCSPVVDDPDGVGEPCLVEGSPTSGIDSCDYGAMCWEVDPETNEGTCVAFCVGSPELPECESDATTCVTSGDGVLALCLPGCDPIVQDCIEGDACYPVDQTFMCIPDSSGDLGAPGDPCDFINACDQGMFCASVDVVPPGYPCEGASGCCTPFCSLADPMPPCLPGQGCTPWYEAGMAPAGYEDVGACSVPM